MATPIKLDQRTPVRGAVQLKDGSWLVGGGWIDAAGGGCSAPPLSRVKGDWAQHLGEVRGGLWRTGDKSRLRLAFRHPMETGLVNNIAAYYLDELSVTSTGGRPLGRFRFQAAMKLGLSTSGRSASAFITACAGGHAAQPCTVNSSDDRGPLDRRIRHRRCGDERQRHHRADGVVPVTPARGRHRRRISDIAGLDPRAGWRRTAGCRPGARRPTRIVAVVRRGRDRQADRHRGNVERVIVPPLIHAGGR